ncbi:MAG: class I SAM-dependent methyltransferase [Methanosarcinales archaeon]|nr:MAG: class I SAM-dependent methyltransferase [Methanosarcinales archaeon]
MIEMITLDIGCGPGKIPNSVGVDIRRTKGADVIADIQYLPFKDQSVDKILCYQLLEHVDDLIKAMEEINRVLKWGGRVIIEVPHVKGLDAFRDPTHKNFFTIATMNYFTVNSGFSYYSKARFKIISRRIILKNKWCGLLEKIVNLRPEFAEHFLGGNLKPHIVWVLENGEGKYF